MGVASNIRAFPGKGSLMTKAKLERELANLREKLLPYYEDDDDQLDADIFKQRAKEFGAVGIMSAIAWCHGQIAIYSLMSDIANSG